MSDETITLEEILKQCIAAERRVSTNRANALLFRQCREALVYLAIRLTAAEATPTGAAALTDAEHADAANFEMRSQEADGVDA